MKLIPIAIIVPVLAQLLLNDDTAAPRLLFKSGFEEGVYIDKVPIENALDYQIIRGEDAETGFSWPISIRGATNSGLHCISDNNGKAVSANILSTTGRDGKPTRALFQKENYAFRGDTQCPYEILDITDGRKDLYIKYWIKIDGASVRQPSADLWRTFFEFKTKDYASGRGFRLISFIYNDRNGVPYWHWQGDKDPQHPIWEQDNKCSAGMDDCVPVPMDQWFKTEFYWHWSEGNDGRALWKINGQIVGDFHGPSTRNGKPIDFIMLSQIYGNSNPKHQWVDDIEIWDGLVQ